MTTVGEALDALTKPPWPGMAGTPPFWIRPIVGLIRGSVYVVAAACLFAMLMYIAAISALKRVVSMVLHLTRLERLVRRFPVAATLGSSFAIGFVAHTSAAMSGGIWWQAALVVAAACLLIFTYVGAAHLWALRGVADHKTLEALRASVETGAIVRWFARRLRHPEDAIYVRAIVSATVIAGLPTAALFVPALDSWVIWPWFFVAISCHPNLESVNHYGSHSAFSRAPKGASQCTQLALRGLGLFLQLGPIFLTGGVPFLTRTLHNAWHHIAQNGRGDFETTYPYDRTSFVRSAPLYLNCMFSYSFGLDLIPYLWAKRHTRAYKRHLHNVLFGLAYAYGILGLVALLSPPLALFMLLTRMFHAGFTYGNLAYFSHAFVDPAEPKNSFKNSTEWATTNLSDLGEQFHSLHHLYPGRHWTRLRQLRRALSARYRAASATVFQKEVIIYLLFLNCAKRFDVLAQHLLDPEEIAHIEEGGKRSALPLRTAARTCELAALLEYRSHPQGMGRPNALAGAVDRLAAAIMVRLVPRSVLEYRRDVQVDDDGGYFEPTEGDPNDFSTTWNRLTS